MIKKLLLLTAATLFSAAPLAAQDVIQRITADPGTDQSAHAGARGLVSSADIRASEAGREMLAQGGTAADAAMATMIALSVVEPQSSGIGGGGFFVYHDAATNQTITVDGRERAPAAARGDRFIGADGQPMPMRVAVPGGRSVGVPGNIRLAAEVHRRYGRVAWAQLFAPAIRLAEEGFEVNRWLAAALEQSNGYWDNFPETRAQFSVDGRIARRGDRIRNPQMAAMLREVASRGPDAFYTGATARAIVQATTRATANPGDMTMADLAAYRATPRDPLCFQYRVYRVCGMGPPSSGGTTVFAILGMLEGFDMQAMGPENPMSWHLLSEAMHLAYADRDAYVGDPDFVDVPTAGLIDERYLAERARLISPFVAANSYAPGTPPGAAARTRATGGEVPSTSHFVAVDRAGNVASMTSTVEGIFGSQLVARGMVLNNELTDFSMEPERHGAPVANRVEPGKRPRSSMSPTIVYGPDGRVVLALGSAGGPRIIMHVVKTLIGVLDFGLPVDQAIALPNLYMAGDGDIIENTELGTRLGTQLARFGRPVLTSGLTSKLNALQWNPDGSGWTGAADPRSLGAVAVEAMATVTPEAANP
jgi:gamma-glutamyltranspeptidase/glutathione hydrolase